MSVDVLQEKIRKKKNPTMLQLTCSPMEVPFAFLQTAESQAQACGAYFEALLETLKDQIPAVRVSFSSFALLGPEGLELLPKILKKAQSLGYYILLDAPQILSPDMAMQTAQVLFSSPYCFDGLILSAYLGSDILKPFLPQAKKADKEIFVICRTANKSASELQDLLTGSRVVHMAAADQVNRYGGVQGKHGFYSTGIVAAASAAESLRMLRATYPQMFMVLDGYDYPNSNARNCSFAFDRFGHGAIASAGSVITGAHLKAEDEDWQKAVLAAADRVKKNLTRYVQIL